MTGPAAERFGCTPRIHPMLTKRQELILQCVVDEHLESGKPVGSKALATKKKIIWSASTVRAEL